MCNIKLKNIYSIPVNLMQLCITHKMLRQLKTDLGSALRTYNLSGGNLINHNVVSQLQKYTQSQIQQLIMQLASIDYSTYNDLLRLCCAQIPTLNFGVDFYTNPLFHASRLGNFSKLKLLIENGADINYLSQDNTTAIMFAFQNAHMQIVKYLYGLGASIKTVSVSGEQIRITDFHSSKLKINDYIDLLHFVDDTHRMFNLFKSPDF